jgi:haloacetate dehalogenase
MFEEFTLETRTAAGLALRLRRGGSGPPLLLLHGNPQTHAMWQHVAPALARDFTVICPDLPGYGFSAKPPVTADHAPHSKREMARVLQALMGDLGFPRFQIAAHDRGARVAHRMVLDHPAAVERLCVMDIVPTLHHFETADMDFAMGYHHWFFLAQPHPKPERMILQDVTGWFDDHTLRGPASVFTAEARADYLAALQAPGTVASICEDYRAAATIDLVHDRASRAAGQKIGCPLLVLWGGKGKIGRWYQPLEVWQGFSTGPVTGGPVASGHYLAEEAPAEVLAALEGFLVRNPG